MRNVQMIRMEPGLIWIPIERAVLCKSCQTVSTSVERRCGLCGSEQIRRLTCDDPDPSRPSPAQGAALAA
jgi:hypothetical protein